MGTGLFFLLLMIIMGGCSSSTSSGHGSGGGYSINLSAPLDMLPAGGTAIITARVRDASGNPVPDDTTVIFTADKGTIETGVKTVSGVVQVVYTAPASTVAGVPGVAKITAASLGATAYISIYIFVP